MALIDKETIRKEIERLEGENNCGTSDFIEAKRIAYKQVKKALDTLPEQPKDGKEQTVNLPKWQKLKNIDSYSNRKIWKDDKMLFVSDSEGYLYGCSIRELFDKLPKEE